MSISRLRMATPADRAKARCLWASNAIHGRRGPDGADSVGVTIVAIFGLACIVWTYLWWKP